MGDADRDSRARARADAATVDVFTEPAHPPEAGTSIGRYVIVEELGEGGMGQVMRAYDPRLHREVALKLVRSEEADRDAHRRMLVEARAMAQLSHPNVLSLHDVEDSGRGLVLVMEYVAGQTLLDWSRERRRPWVEVVDHYRAAGRGLAAAHAEGLLHRDFKPSNVLLSDAGEVKVADFGLASLPGTHRDIALSLSMEPSLDVSQHRGHILGTPRYMSPEQHRRRNLDGRSDQYSLCVSLWEALVGRPPFVAPPEELLDRKELGPPPWPADAPSVPEPIVEAIRRGMSVDPNHRWPTIDDLLDVLAYDPKAKLRRGAMVVVGLGVLALVVAAVQSPRVERAEPCRDAPEQLAGVWDPPRRDEVRAALRDSGVAYAESALSRTEAALDRYADAWTRMYTEACEATRVRGEQSSVVMDLRMRCLHQVRVELNAITRVLADADADVVARAHVLVGGLPSLEPCAEVEPSGERSGEGESVSGVRTHLARAKAEREAGHLEQAQQALEAAEEALDGVVHGPVHLEFLLERGFLLADRGEFVASETTLREVVQRASIEGAWDVLQQAASKLLVVVGTERQRPEEALHYREFAMGLARGRPKLEAIVHDNLGLVLGQQGRYSEAEAAHQRAIALLEQIPDADPSRIVASRGHLGHLLILQGDYERAEQELRGVVAAQESLHGPEHPLVIGARSDLANAFHVQGKDEEAEAEHRQVLALREKMLGPEHPDVAATHNNIGGTLYRQGDLEGAEAAFRRAIAIWQATLGPTYPSVILVRTNLAGVLFSRGERKEAEAEFRRLLVLVDEELGAEHPDSAMTHHNLGVILLDDEPAEAEAEFRRAAEIRQRVLGPAHPRTLESWSSVADALEATGQRGAAMSQLRAALARADEVPAADDDKLAALRFQLAGLLLDDGDADGALPLAQEAFERLGASEADPELRAQTGFMLARALAEAGDGDDGDRSGRARGLAERARQDYLAADAEDYADEIAAVDAWLETATRRDR